MVAFFTTTLALSIVGLFSLVTIKRWEMRTGKILWGSVRPAVGETLHQALVFFERVLPALLRGALARAWRRARALLRAAVAWGVLMIERLLERVLRGIRRKTSVPQARKAHSSGFLREVAEHKKKLLEMEDRAIYED